MLVIMSSREGKEQSTILFCLNDLLQVLLVYH